MDDWVLLETQFKYCRVLPRNHFQHNDWEHVRVTDINRWYVQARDIIQALNLNADQTLACSCPPIYTGTRQVTFQSLPVRVTFRPHLGRPRPPNIIYEDQFISH
jgi:hypothetical protein